MQNYHLNGGLLLAYRLNISMETSTSMEAR